MFDRKINYSLFCPFVAADLFLYLRRLRSQSLQYPSKLLKPNNTVSFTRLKSSWKFVSFLYLIKLNSHREKITKKVEYIFVYKILPFHFDFDNFKSTDPASHSTDNTHMSSAVKITVNSFAKIDEEAKMDDLIPLKKRGGIYYIILVAGLDKTKYIFVNIFVFIFVLEQSDSIG